jgi:hypothetical protein
MKARPMTIAPEAAASGCLGSSKAPTLMHCPLLPIPAVAWLARYAPNVWPANCGRALPAKNHDTHVDQKSSGVSGKSGNLTAIESKNAVLPTQARAKPACAAAKSPRGDSALSKKGSQSSALDLQPHALAFFSPRVEGEEGFFGRHTRLPWSSGLLSLLRQAMF